MAGIYFDRRRKGALRHHALLLWIDRPVRRGSHSDGAETHAVDQDVGPEVVERRVNRAICQNVRALFSILQSVVAPWLKGPVPLQSDVFGVLLALIPSLAVEEFRNNRREYSEPLDLRNVTAIFDDFDPRIGNPRRELLSVD
jgi:hypothetical protein